MTALLDDGKALTGSRLLDEGEALRVVAGHFITVSNAKSMNPIQALEVKKPVD